MKMVKHRIFKNFFLCRLFVDVNFIRSVVIITQPVSQTVRYSDIHIFQQADSPTEMCFFYFHHSSKNNNKVKVSGNT
jgi:hypothetical protein